MRVLITGGTGLLGKALTCSRASGVEVLATFVGEYEMQDNDQVKYCKLDIRDRSGYDKLFLDFKPDAVIHAAGIGSPDYAETNREAVTDINVNGTMNILELCEIYGSRLVFISSNGIYDGDNAPYSEEDKAEPVNYYGEVKLKGEEIVKGARIPFAIVRPILMYGWPFSFERANIVTLVISKLNNGEKIHAYEDVYANPLLNVSCAAAIWKIVSENISGVFNISGADRVSIYQLLLRTAEVFDMDKDLISPVRQGFFNELARRPSDTTFKTDKMEKVLGIKPLPLEEGLKIMKETA